MKFNHIFQLTNHNDNTYIFECDGKTARLDFTENMVRVALYPTDAYLFPTFSICPDGNMPENGRERHSLDGISLIKPEVQDNKDNIDFFKDDLHLHLEKKNFQLAWYQKNKLLFKDRDYIAYNFEKELGNGSCHYITREEDEKIYGLGDKTGKVNKNKRSFRLGTGDAMGFDARSSDPLYKHIPFYMCQNSIGSYGIYYDTYSDGAFDFGREINNYYAPFKSFRCEDNILVYYVFFGTISQILNHFVTLRGKDFMPPKCTFQYCGSTMAYTDAPDAEKQLLHFIDLCHKYDIHPGGFYLSSGYTQIGDKRYVFHWNTDKIPDPKALSDTFRKNGIEFLPNIKPCFLNDHPLYKEIAEHGWFLKDKDGNPALFPFWGGIGSYLDFTNPGAAAFWTDCVRTSLVDKGYLSTWNDNNEYDIQDEEVIACGFGHPIKAKRIKPLFSYLMTRASLKAQKENTRKNAVSRCGIAGTSRIASTWTGDNRTSFDDFRYNHKMAMTMSLSGIYNFGQDIGGFAGPRPGKELFLRWIQYGIFTPRFVLHSWNDDKSSNMPWLYEDEIPTVQRLFHLREKLTDYIYNEVYRSTRDGNPVIYPLFLKYPEADPESDVFFCGDGMLACPVFDQGKEKVEVDLPENNGNWYQGENMVSGHIAETCTIHDNPVFFFKGGSVVLFDNTYLVFAEESGSFEETYLEDDGISPLVHPEENEIHFTVTCDHEKITVETDKKPKYPIRSIDGFHRVSEIHH